MALHDARTPASEQKASWDRCSKLYAEEVIEKGATGLTAQRIVSTLKQHAHFPEGHLQQLLLHPHTTQTICVRLPAPVVQVLASWTLQAVQAALLYSWLRRYRTRQSLLLIYLPNLLTLLRSAAKLQD